VGELFSKENSKSTTIDDQNLFRMMILLLKLFAAKDGMTVYREVLEYFA
jgi:hypothetical protein